MQHCLTVEIAGMVFRLAIEADTEADAIELCEQVHVSYDGVLVDELDADDDVIAWASHKLERMN